MNDPIRQALAQVDTLDSDVAAFGCFESIASMLLRRVQLIAFGRVCRFLEVEFYYHAPVHPDPFTHRAAAQATHLRWYLHRTGSGFRSGSFKGIDLTFGGDGAFGGILVRSIELDDGRVVGGPSLSVDALIALSGVDSVRALHDVIGGRDADDPDIPLQLDVVDERDVPIFNTSRVGLSLKTATAEGRHRAYILRRYRFLTRPRDVRKGRVNLVLALHRDGVPADRIHEITGSPRRTISEYLGWADRGTGEAVDDATFSPARARDLCNLSHELEA